MELEQASEEIRLYDTGPIKRVSAEQSSWNRIFNVPSGILMMK